VSVAGPLAAKLDLDARLVRAARVMLARHLLTPSSGRETLYLLVGAVVGQIGFTIITVLVPLAFGLSFALIGLPVAVLAARIARGWCGIDRRRAALVLGAPIPGRYATFEERGFIARRLLVLTDRQTWLDALWMVLALPLGVLGASVALLAWLALPGLLFAPVYAWSIPGWIHAHDVAISIIAPFLALPAAVLGAWLLHPAALAHARAAAYLLGPSRSELLAARVESLSESRAGAVDAAVSELQRVERDLHDGAQARLVALAMDLGLAEQRLSGADPQTALEHVTAARTQARAAMAELRDLVRGIGPSILQDRGLDAALTALVAGRTPPVDLYVRVPKRRAGARETAAYFVVAEALANARKHAEASQVWVRVWEGDDRRLIVEVVDNGVGGAQAEGGSGLTGLRQRVAALDGGFELDSPPGGPTTVRAELPSGA
jgi:signal transduction histidine kinase